MRPRVSRTVEIGIVIAEGRSRELAEQLEQALPRALAERHGGTEWQASLSETGPAEPGADRSELFDSVRRCLLAEEWALALGLTELPLRSGRQPVTAEANPQQSVGLVSVPALGGVNVGERLCRTAVEVVEGIVGGDARQRELASSLTEARARDDGSIRFVAATLRGNLRLLAGTIRANEPTRVITRLSRALAGALGTAAFALASANVWTLADGMTTARLVGLALASTLATSLALTLAHDLWERSDDARARERVILFNLATVCTIAMGVAVLYLGLFSIAALGAVGLIPTDVFKEQVGHDVALGDYLGLACLVASLATIGGALGSLVESDLSVRNAAQRSTEVARKEDREDER
jgi:hypothetical protein